MRRRARAAEALSLPPMSPLAFSGSVELRVIAGCVRVLGFELAASPKASAEEWHTIHSPAGGLMVVLQTASAVSSGARVQLRRIEGVVPSHGERRRSATATPRRGDGKTVFADNNDGGDEDADDADGADDAEYVEVSEHGAEVAGDGVDGNAGARGPDGDLAAKLGIQRLAALNLTSRLGALVPPAWEASVEALATLLTTDARPVKGGTNSTHAAPVVMLCGARNVGKSAFARLLLNRALSDGAAVSYTHLTLPTICSV